MADIKVSRICNNDCIFTCYKKDCPRGSWAKAAFSAAPLRQTREDKQCPMMQFNARKSDKYTMFVLNEEGLWNICKKCKYSTKGESDEVNIEKAFELHCIDCPVQNIREAIQERQAESRMS